MGPELLFQIPISFDSHQTQSYMRSVLFIQFRVSALQLLYFSLRIVKKHTAFANTLSATHRYFHFGQWRLFSSNASSRHYCNTKSKYELITNNNTTDHGIRFHGIQWQNNWNAAIWTWSLPERILKMFIGQWKLSPKVNEEEEPFGVKSHINHLFSLGVFYPSFTFTAWWSTVLDVGPRLYRSH